MKNERGKKGRMGWRKRKRKEKGKGRFINLGCNKMAKGREKKLVSSQNSDILTFWLQVYFSTTVELSI